MGGYYVCIDNVPAEKLEFLGYAKVTEDDRFEIWQDLTGDEHIILKAGPRYLHMDDLNDAIILGAVKVVPAPSENNSN